MEDIETPRNKRKKTEFRHSDNSSDREAGNSSFLQGYLIHILEAGIGKVRSELFRKKIIELGGTLCSSISDHPNVLLVDDNMTVDRLFRLLKVEGPQQLESLVVVRSLWLSDSIKNRKLLPNKNYRLPLIGLPLSTKVNPPTFLIA